MTALTHWQPRAGFHAGGHGRRTVHLADFRGKKQVVLAFYPKDLSGG